MSSDVRLPFVVPIKGGLGNQLFQVCFAAYLSRLIDRKVLVCNSWFRRRQSAATQRDQLVDPADVGLKEVHLFRLVRILLRRWPVGFRFHFEHEPDFSLEASQLLRAFCIKGEFGSARFPLSDLEVSRALVRRSERSRATGEYVAVHSRLGDYLSAPATSALLGAIDPNWLLERGKEIAKELGVEEIRIFTDSPDVLASKVGPSNLRSACFNQSTTAWDVLAGMRGAAGLVMSNSSLSWWAVFSASVLDCRPIPVMMPRPFLAQPSPADTELWVDGWRIEDRRLMPEP